MVFLFYIIAAGCSFLRATSGNPSNPIQSPNYPNNYNNNDRKTWHIEVSKGKQIEITFDAFQLEAHRHRRCYYDWLKIVDGNGQIVLQQTCGTSAPTKIISNSNKVTVTFHSDGSITKKGFSFNWKEGVNACPCGWSLYKTTCYQWFDSPLTWTQSKTACESEKGNLATIPDIGTNIFINNLKSSQSRGWIGGFQRSGSDPWEWTDQSSSWAFENWSLGEPNGGSENCVEMYLTGGAAGKWNDLPCSSTYAYVCEKGVTTCPSGWSLYKTTCYQWFDSPLTWTQSKTACENEQGNLATIPDIETNSFINNLQSSQSSGWIGGFQRSGSDPWEWTDQSSWAFENWNSGEPNGGSENCVQMYFTGGAAGKWNDLPCSRTHAYVCVKQGTNAVPGQSGWHQHQFPGIETNVAVGPAGIWGINSAHEIYKKTSNSWEKVDGKLKDISVGHHVWGVNKDDDILRMNEGTWENIPGKLMQVSASGVNGVNGAVWGVKSDNSIHRYRSASSDWERVGGGLMMVSCGQPGVWGVNSQNDIYYRVGTYGGVDSAGQSWKKVDGDLIWISSGSMGDVYGVSSDGSPYKREGITEINPTGTHWLHVSSAFLMKQVDVFAGVIWGVRKSDQRSRSGNQVLQKDGPAFDEDHPFHKAVAKDLELKEEDILKAADYEKICVTCSVILMRRGSTGILEKADTYQAGYVESVIKVTKNELGPKIEYVNALGIMKINLGGNAFEQIDFNLLGLEQSQHVSSTSVGIGAKVVLAGGSVSIFDIQLAAGVSFEIGIVDDSFTLKVAGTGLKVGRKLGVCVWETCFGVDFGRLFF